MRIGIDLLGAIAEDTGARTYAIYFLRALARIDARDEFVVFWSSPGDDVAADLPRDQFRKVFVDNTRSPEARILFQQVGMRRLVKAEKLDLLYGPGNSVTISAGIPTVVSIRNMDYYHYPHLVGFRRRVVRKLLTPLYARSAKRVIVPSTDIKLDVLRFLRVEPAKIRVIPHGVDTEYFASRASRMEVDETLAGLSVKPPFMLFVSGLREHKGANLLLLAYHRARQKGLRHSLVIAGGTYATDYVRRLRLMVTEEGLAGSVRFVGHLDHEKLRVLYQSADLMVFPSLYESFGHPLLEAMAAGLPVIASRCHAIPETVGDAAVLINPQDSDEFSRTILHVLRDEGLRKKLVCAGARRTAAFSWGRCALETLSVLHQCA